MAAGRIYECTWRTEFGSERESTLFMPSPGDALDAARAVIVRREGSRKSRARIVGLTITEGAAADFIATVPRREV